MLTKKVMIGTLTTIQCGYNFCVCHFNKVHNILIIFSTFHIKKVDMQLYGSKSLNNYLPHPLSVCILSILFMLYYILEANRSTILKR